MSIISASNLHKYYGDLHVLKGVDLAIEKGEIITIVGKSGAGKSTLLHLLGTLDAPSKGEIAIVGEFVHQLSTTQLAKFRNKHIGFIFQFHHLLPEFTAIENVCLPAYLHDAQRTDVTAKAQQLLERLGVAHRQHHKPKELSGGEQQRVAVARALINEPAVVFADEPSGNLDKKSSEELHELLFQLRQEWQQTFVIVTHNQSLAAMSDRCLTMEDGRLVS